MTTYIPTNEGVASDFLKEFFFQKIAGGEFMGFNNAVFMSERETADRNFAMAYYMKENRCFPPKTSLHDIMDLYFQVDIHYLNGNNLFSIDYLEFLVSISLLFFLNCTISSHVQWK